ncbi:hypothetical protein GV829_04595 [Sphingomonas lacunae]|uniref:Uncharacterized protein n=1 Tax=Sphingomonas lacunae TaxID=2698828 RepID=A0A6M4ARX6_9SPHN|nr:hypothetical protein [Sphingomonas lacunae]QJQ31814.1 hypothetical protein GV829_04595 [Sphingomonas lacunae]
MSGTGGVEKFSGDAMRELRDEFEAVQAASAGEQVALPIDLTESDAHHALPDASEIVAIQMELGCDVGEAVREHRRRGRGGRPKGAKNRRTEEFSRYILQFGPHPGVTLARIQGRPTEVLAKELGCSMEAAMGMQIRAAAELLPYVEGKKPVEVNMHHGGHMSLVLEQGGAMDGGLIEGAAIEPMLAFAPMPDDGVEMAEKRGFDEAEEGHSE